MGNCVSVKASMEKTRGESEQRTKIAITTKPEGWQNHSTDGGRAYLVSLRQNQVHLDCLSTDILLYFLKTN